MMARKTPSHVRMNAPILIWSDRAPGSATWSNDPGAMRSLARAQLAREEPADVGIVGAMDLGGAAHVGEAPLVEDGHLVRDEIGELEVVRDDHGGVADPGAKLGDKLGDEPGIGGVEA